jgi:hypothetical protein
MKRNHRFLWIRASDTLKIYGSMGFFLYRYPDKILILYIQHEIKEEEEHEDDGDAFVEDVDEGDMEDEVDNDHTLEAEDFEEGEPSATSTPRRGHLPRPLVRSGFDFLIRIWETKKF